MTTDTIRPTDRRPSAVAVGVFDGVHTGHRALLKEMIQAARTADLRPVVVTFFPHPKEVTQNLSGRLYLATIEQRRRQLHAAGIEEVVVYPFDEETRHMRARAFMVQLHERLHMRQLWSGDFGLGYQREGTADFLRPIGQEMGVTIHEYDRKMHLNGERVSSSRIRHGLHIGDIVDVNACLGRPYRITGPVTKGEQRGRTIGFPTANLRPWEKLILPGHGVYATLARLEDGRIFPAATNVGVRPTVDGMSLRAEAFLLDFTGDLYDTELALDFVARVRPEIKFDGLAQLKSQIAADVEQVRDILR